MENASNPKHRLSQEEIADLQITVAQEMAEDTWLALCQNFPPEQLQALPEVEDGLRNGWLNLHELRSKKSGHLLSARLMVVYQARKRSEAVFILVAWVVTPDRTEHSVATSQGKGKGYGSFLRGPSYELSRKHNPHALGLVAERESPVGVLDSDQSVKRASWMRRIGLLRIDDLNYEIPPLVSASEHKQSYIPVAERQAQAKSADLLLTRFDGERTINGQHVHSIIDRIYESGYAININDPYRIDRLAKVNLHKQYELTEN